jgi:spermidine synthase
MCNILIFSIYFISGLVSLVYQTVWLRELGLVFGNSVTSSSITISLFFSGLAFGSWVFSHDLFKNVSKIKQYIILELVIGVLALLFFPIKEFYWNIYPDLSLQFPEMKSLFHVLLASIIIIPPTIFMGATFPVLGEVIGKLNSDKKDIVLLLYFSNIIGACIGVFLTGFILPQLTGFNITYGLACFLNILLAFYVFHKGRHIKLEPQYIETDSDLNSRIKTDYTMSAFIIGFIFLGLEICWIKSFSLVFHNSIYTYATILMVVIFSIGLAALTPVSKRYLKITKSITNNSVLWALAFTMLFPPLFMFIFQGEFLFDFLAENWFLYSLYTIFIISFFILPASYFSSLPFPLMLKKNLSKGVTQKHIGQLYSANTFGGILGSLITGLVLIPLFGTWKTYYILCVLFFPLLLLFTPAEKPQTKLKTNTGYLLIILSILMIFVDLPPLAVKGDEKLLWYKDSSMAQVSVVKSKEKLLLKINNSYYLGGTGTFQAEKLQSHIPFSLKTESKEVYLLGLGTGITAGEVLNFDNKNMLVAELNPIVVEASKLYFKPFINNLYESSNAKVLADDGRTVLYGTSRIFDVIIADLFVTWNKGVGSLYSYEHFTKAKEKLKDDGLYVQWLPFYNFFREEFWSVVKTMKKVFPRVTMWQLMLHPNNIVVGLIGHKNTDPIKSTTIKENLKTYNKINSKNILNHYYRLPSYFYADLSDCDDVTDNYVLNTEDYPYIEFHSPKSAIRTSKGKQAFLLGQNFLNLNEEISKNCKKPYDYLNELSLEDIDVAISGKTKLIYNIKKIMKLDNSAEIKILKSKLGRDKNKMIQKAESEL